MEPQTPPSIYRGGRLSRPTIFGVIAPERIDAPNVKTGVQAASVPCWRMRRHLPVEPRSMRRSMLGSMLV